MKRIHALIAFLLLALALFAFSQAAAAPVLADGETTAWIGDDSSLYLMDGDGNTSHLPMLVRDILSFSEDSVYCRMNNLQVYAINRNGSGSRLVQEQNESVQDQRFYLKNDQLTIGGTTLFQVEAAAADGIRVCAVAVSAGKRTLAVYRPDGTPDISVFFQANSTVPEPKSITLARDTVVITGKDHSLWIGDLKTGSVRTLAASGNVTDGAALIEGMLYLYTLDSNQLWRPERAEALLPEQRTVYRAAVTPTPTLAPVPTPTLKPSPTKTPVPTVDPDDDIIRKWDRGTKVRKMQNRLAELGYPVGNTDGVYGENTQLALNLFYGAIGYKEHNYLSTIAESKLYSRNAPYFDPYLPVKKGTQNYYVLRMQQRLAQLGYDAGKQDGIYGAQTVAAVALFQEACGLYPPEDEEPGENASRELLIRLYATDAPSQGPVPQVQWQQTTEGWVCYLSGVMATGWQKVNGKWYYFASNGIMQTGWIQVGSDRYYSNADGVMQTGWQQIGGYWYYFVSSGKMQRGWLEDKKAEKKSGSKTAMWYWFDADGKMVTGEQTIDGKQEVFDSSGLWLYTR